MAKTPTAEIEKAEHTRQPEKRKRPPKVAPPMTRTKVRRWAMMVWKKECENICNACGRESFSKDNYFNRK
jgi:hypothetical protein